MTSSWKPSPRSPLGTVSTSLTADTEKTRRKNGARERGNGAWCTHGTSRPGSNRASEVTTKDLFSHGQAHLLGPCPSCRAQHSGLEIQEQARCDAAQSGGETGKKGNHPNRRQSKVSSKERRPKGVVLAPKESGFTLSWDPGKVAFHPRRQHFLWSPGTKGFQKTPEEGGGGGSGTSSTQRVSPLPCSGQKSSAGAQAHLPPKPPIILWGFRWLRPSLPWCQYLVPVTWPVAMSISAGNTRAPQHPAPGTPRVGSQSWVETFRASG